MSSTSIEYSSWYNMKQRCLNKYHPSYRNYGGRGIKICDRWLESKTGFVNFLEDMGKKPSIEYMIERLDNDGNYEPRNCKWATRKIQMRNKRTNKLSQVDVDKIRLLHSSGAYTHKELGKRYSVSSTTIRDIINKKYWKEQSFQYGGGDLFAQHG